MKKLNRMLAKAEKIREITLLNWAETPLLHNKDLNPSIALRN
jgi:hypothetical protein